MMTIKLTGPGLVVNTPTAIIYKALKEAGFIIHLDEFDGQYQYSIKEDWPDNQLEAFELVKLTYPNHIHEIRLEVDAQPWGG